MRLLVIEAESHQVENFRSEIALQQAHDCLIDMASIVVHLIERGPRERMPQGARGTVAHCVVVRIEQVSERGMESAIARQMFGKKKRFEEPRGVRQVPLRGTRSEERRVGKECR